ncbi:MAG: SufD family Fe-S cluster assembly protein [Steroidobacteraceae bacterium]
MTPTAAETTSRALDAFARLLPADVENRAARLAALDRLLAAGWPEPRGENWRYSDLRTLTKAGAAACETVSSEDLALAAAHWQITGAEPLQIVLLDGRPSNLAALQLPPGLAINCDDVSRNAAELTGNELAPAWLNDGFAPITLHIMAEGECPPLELLCATTAPDLARTSYVRVQIDLAPRARLQIHERHLQTSGESAHSNVSVELNVAAGATLTHWRDFILDGKLSVVDSVLASVDSAGCLEQLLAVAGGESSRHGLQLRLRGDDACGKVFQAVSAHDRARHDCYNLFELSGARTRVEHMCRAIAADGGSAACNSHVRATELARGAVSAQSLRGLLLASSAQIALRPQLQINTDEIRANHGATTGRLDEQMLFYLLSRGLDAQTATGLLKWTFIADALALAPRGGLREDLAKRFADQLAFTLPKGLLQ